MTTSHNYGSATMLLQALEEADFPLTPPIDVDEIAKLLGITVEYDADLESRDAIGEISFSGDMPLVKINPFQNSYDSRRRFTLAHEIGHYCLHSASTKQGFTDSRKTMSRSDSYWDPYESEANSFAAQLLMPKKLVLKEGSRVIEDHKKATGSSGMPVNKFIEAMRGVFGVSSKAMEYRLKNLKIIT